LDLWFGEDGLRVVPFGFFLAFLLFGVERAREGPWGFFSACVPLFSRLPFNQACGINDCLVQFSLSFFFLLPSGSGERGGVRRALQLATANYFEQTRVFKAGSFARTVASEYD